MPSRAEPAPRVTLDGDTAVIRIADQHLGTRSGESLDQPLSRLIDDLGRVQVDLDFAAVGFLSSVGLATLMTLHKKLRTAGGRLALLNVRPHIHEVLAVTRLTTVLGVREKQAG
jgi:anti-anti-sigma factor